MSTMAKMLQMRRLVFRLLEIQESQFESHYLSGEQTSAIRANDKRLGLHALMTSIGAGRVPS